MVAAAAATTSLLLLSPLRCDVPAGSPRPEVDSSSVAADPSPALPRQVRWCGFHRLSAGVSAASVPVPVPTRASASPASLAFPRSSAISGFFDAAAHQRGLVLDAPAALPPPLWHGVPVWPHAVAAGRARCSSPARLCGLLHAAPHSVFLSLLRWRRGQISA